MTRTSGRHDFVCSLAVVVAVLSVSACQREPAAEGSLAQLRAAVQEDPDLELIATDEEAEILTVRVRSADRVLTVTADDLEGGQIVVAEGAGGTAGIAASSPGGEEHVVLEGPAGRIRATDAPGEERVVLEGPGGRLEVSETGEGVTLDVGGQRETVDRSGRRVSVTTEESPARPSSSPGGELRRLSDPIDCRAGQVERLESVLLEAAEVAIRAQSGCQVVVRNSEIRAGEHAVEARSGARVELVDSLVMGRDAAVLARSNAVVSARGSEIHGEVLTRTGGRFEDLGGNTLR